MNTGCKSFRNALERHLAEAPSSVPWRDLGWHRHVLTCADCRELLASEEALDALLATLPEPRLSRRIVERLLVRLRASRMAEDELDRLLALDRSGSESPDVAQRVLAGIEPQRAAESKRRDAALDALLARNAVAVPPGLSARVLERLKLLEPRAGIGAEAGAERSLDRVLDAWEVDVPHDFAARTLAGLRVERGTTAHAAHASLRSRAPVRPAVRPMVALARSRWVWAAAAGIVVTLAAWLAWRPGRLSGPAPIVVDPQPRPAALPEDQAPLGVPQPGAELLSALDVLEQWDLLMRDDLDVLLSTLEPADESLLDVESAALPPEEPAGESETDPDRRKG